MCQKAKFATIAATVAALLLALITISAVCAYVHNERRHCTNEEKIMTDTYGLEQELRHDAIQRGERPYPNGTLVRVKGTGEEFLTTVCSHEPKEITYRNLGALYGHEELEFLEWPSDD